MPSSDQVATESLLCFVGAFFNFWFSWLGVRWVIIRHKRARLRRILTRTHVHVRLHGVAVVCYCCRCCCCCCCCLLMGIILGIILGIFVVVVVIGVVVVNVVAVSFPKQGIIHLRRNNIIQS